MQNAQPYQIDDFLTLDEPVEHVPVLSNPFGQHTLPTTKLEIVHYVNELLLPKEHYACDRATD